MYHLYDGACQKNKCAFIPHLKEVGIHACDRKSI